jgi:7-cyano-7-deazaguanine reductase
MKELTMKPPIEGTHLGKSTVYPNQYSPGLLVAVPRKENRERYNIVESALPFVGQDVWHAWEAGFLTDTGFPVVGILKLVYDCTSASLVESKSLKLYLNSYNMENLGPTVADAIKNFVARVKADLSRLLQVDVAVSFFQKADPEAFDFHHYSLLEDNASCATGPFVDHVENPNLLLPGAVETRSDTAPLCVCTHLLRSNCKITHQPDWGSAFIRMQGPIRPAEDALLRYIVSFRSESHFHEEVCEMIYKRLFDLFHPESLAVTSIYTRRGGIDICPTRASAIPLLPAKLTSSHTLTLKLPRQ